MKKSVKTVLIGGVLVMVAIVTVAAVRGAKENKKESSQASRVSLLSKAKGSDLSPVRIVGFSDFQCPACAHASPMIDALMEKYPGKIQYVFKHFPLRMHPWAAVAHQGAECASVQEKFWDYYKKLYSNQASWSVMSDPMVAFAEYAQAVGLDMQAFTGCMADPKVAERIMSEKKEGEELQVRSTPTFFINGKMFAGPQELQMNGEAFVRSVLGLPPEAPAAVPATAEKQA